MTKIKLRPGRYSLVRDGDGAGDSGTLLLAIDPETKKSYAYEVRVGCAVQCGSVYARTMQVQDWWRTTPVTKIISKTKDKIKFETKNSVYTLKVI